MTDELLEQFKQDATDDYDQTKQQREDANQDLRFIGVKGGMWEDYLESTHGSDSNRARLEFDLTSDALMDFVGEWTTNRAGVIYNPDDTKTSDDDAELLTGVYRGDFRENGGKASQDQGMFEAAAAGMGAIQLSEKFVDEEDPENDTQEIIWKTVHNAFDHVMFDANAKEADKSDANWVTKLTGFTPKAFKAKYPDLTQSSAYVPTTSYQNAFDWYSEQLIYVAERWEIKHIDDEVSVWQNVNANKINTYPMDQLEKARPELEAFGWDHVRDRKIKRQIVEKSIFTGDEWIQKPKRIAGKFLPIVPFYGYRVFIGGKEYYWGLIRKLMDGNRTANTLISKLAETSAASANDINIYLDEQVEGKELLLADNTDKAYQVINKVIDESTGQSVPMGPVGKITSPQVDQSALAALDTIFNFMQQKRGVQQDTIDPDVSGKAVNALIKQKNLKTQIISNNFITSLGHIGKVYRSKAADLYTKAMMKKSIGDDGTVKTIELNTISMDPQSGNPINMNDLSRGRFSVTVDVGPQYETEREAAVESIERVIEKLPPDSPYHGPALAMWIQNINGQGLRPLQQFNRKIMIQQGLVEAETDEEKQNGSVYATATRPERRTNQSSNRATIGRSNEFTSGNRR